MGVDFIDNPNNLEYVDVDEIDPDEHYLQFVDGVDYDEDEDSDYDAEVMLNSSFLRSVVDVDDVLGDDFFTDDEDDHDFYPTDYDDDDDDEDDDSDGELRGVMINGTFVLNGHRRLQPGDEGTTDTNSPTPSANASETEPDCSDAKKTIVIGSDQIAAIKDETAAEVASGQNQEGASASAAVFKVSYL